MAPTRRPSHQPIDPARWCRTNAYLSFLEELTHNYARTAAAVVETWVANGTCVCMANHQGAWVGMQAW